MISDIKAYFTNLMSVKGWKLSKVILFLVGSILITIFSGYAYTTFGMTSRTKIILYAITFFFFFVYFILEVNISRLKRIKENKFRYIPSYYTMAYILMILISLISFLVNPYKQANLNTYIAFWLTSSISYFVLKLFDFKFILKSFKNIIFFLTLISLVLFSYTAISNSTYSISYFSDGNIVFGNNLFFNIDYITGLTYSLFGNIRLMSVFWEPSVFGVMLILALIADFFTKDKLSIIRLVFFTVAIILTESTASYIIYGYFLIFLIYNKTAKYKTFRKIFASLLFLFSIIFIFFGKDILVYLAKILPNVFGKFVFPESIISFSTRFYSLPNYLKVFAKNPIFGFGGVTSAEIYYDISNGIVDAQTSTIGKIIASFGLAGVIYVISIILGIFLNKKIGLANKLFLFLFFIMLSHVQGQGEIIIINILYFIPFSLVELPNKFKEINKQINTPNIKDKKIFDVAFAKDNDGELSSNIIYSLVVRGISILLAIFTIPIYLRYFNQNNDMYGVWLAITSVLSIITVFDFGMGNGLKNRLIVDINKNDYRHSRTYISTTYFLTLLIGTFIFVLLSIIIFSLNDQTIIRLFFSNQDLSNVNITTFKFSFSIIMLAIGLNFGIKNINYILQAHQKNAIVSSFMLITNASLLLFLLIFANIIPQQNKIIALAIVYNVFLNLPLIIISYYLFSKKYKHLRPSFKLVNFKESKDVIRVGLNFFVVQLGTLFLWSTNEFIILFAYKNANLVTEYTIYYRLFSLLPILLGTVIQQPVWTAISKADADGDYNRIKRYITVLISIAGLFLFINILLTFMLPFVFNIWLGDNSPKVTLIKQIVFIIYSIIYITTMTIVIICNALSLFKAQIVSAIMAIVIKIPLIIILANTTKSSLSWENVILVNMLCYLPIVFYGPFEIRKYIKLKLSNGSLTYSFNNYKKQYKEINI